MDINENDLDWKLATKLRHEDPEQFQTLVRMHLSFVLDLNTDDTEYQPEKEKCRSVKWGFVPFSKKLRPPIKGVMEGAPLTQEGICQVYQLIEFLSREDNIIQEGIFRRTGKVTRQQELKNLLNQGTTIKLTDGYFSIHDCASVLKNFLAELPEPLLTEAYFPAYCQIADLCNSDKYSEGRLEHALQLLVLLLPSENWVMLKDVLQLLHLVALHEQENKMSASNLATLFTPHLLCPRKMAPENLHVTAQNLSRVVAFMISSGFKLFRVPPTLATDIRAYWDQRKLSPDSHGNESSAAKTVFSFVDRERTAQENTTNPTEAALAQLYAHIQSLPESSKKRRLVKQFNKENGNGTPHHTTRARSFGDSIKKHIFSKAAKQIKVLHENGTLKSRSSSEEMISETMMTPRSRKPVVALSGSSICHLANVTCEVKDAQWYAENKQDGSRSCDSDVQDSTNSLTSTFRDYLFSRSILTASPVDLSFSSRTGDFDPSSSCSENKVIDSPLSESLLYCLDGNNPNNTSSGDSCLYRKRNSDELSNEMSCNKRYAGNDVSVCSSGLGMENSRDGVYETSL